MILLRLLSAGKTLVGIGNQEKSYRLPAGGLLPKFDPKANPFRATTLPDRPKAEVVLSAPGQQDLGVPLIKTDAAPEAKVKLPKGGAKARAWVSGLGSLIRTKPAGSERPDRGGSGRPAQTELRLEAVQVVRNDLSESDVEIVPREKALKEFVQRVPGANAAVQQRAETDSAWSRVSARIFGRNNVR